MRNKLGKVQYLLFALLLFALTGCGASNLGGSAAAPGNGSIAAKLQWGADGRTTAKSVALMPSDVTKIRFTVSGAGVPVVRSEITTAGATSGQVDGVYPGTVSLVVQALDTSGATLYEGFAINVVVAAGATSDVGTIKMTVPTVKTADAACLGCHETTIGVTGQNIIAEFKQSGHYTNLAFKDVNGVVTGCAGCHGPSHNIQDPSAIGTGTDATVSARCFDCHNINNSNTALVANHGTFYLANGTACTACHQVHNTKAANMERKTWAQSAHGATDYPNIAGGVSGCALRCHNAKGFIAAVANPTALVQGTMTVAPQMVTCDACHTDAALGKLRALPGTKTTPFAVYTTSTMGYQFAPNQVLNPNKKSYYPDVAGSNLCIVCHSGTTEGTIAALGISDPYFAGRPEALTYTSGGVLKPKMTLTPHNMPAAAVMYVKFGFTNLSTGSAGVPSAAYVASLTSDLDGGTVTSTHRKFGTSAIKTDSHFSASNPAPANFLTNGPCAVCHVSGSHTFKIDQAAITAVCNKCHSSENGIPITTETAFTNSFVEPQQEVFRNAILLGATIVNNKVAAYNLANPTTPIAFGVGIDLFTSDQAGKVVIYKSLKNPLVPYKTDGTLDTNGFATNPISEYQAVAIALDYSATGTDLGFQKFLGALSNIAFLAKDQGAFAHARTYSRRLIFDSLDFLDDGILNMSTGTTAVAALPSLYTKGAKAYNTASIPTTTYQADGVTVKSISYGITTPASGTSESMLYLIGWNRSTSPATTVDATASASSGAWAAVPRP
jgi:hypothetical protein